MGHEALTAALDWQTIALAATIAFGAGLIAAFAYYRYNGPHLIEERESARRHARLAEQSNQFLKSAIEAVPAGLAFFDSESRYVAWNEEYARYVREHAGEI